VRRSARSLAAVLSRPPPDPSAAALFWTHAADDSLQTPHSLAQQTSCLRAEPEENNYRDIQQFISDLEGRYYIALLCLFRFA